MFRIFPIWREPEVERPPAQIIFPDGYMMPIKDNARVIPRVGEHLVPRNSPSYVVDRIEWREWRMGSYVPSIILRAE
jgi:hypothetical protein